MTGKQDSNRTKRTSFIAVEPHFGCNPDRFDYERNAMIITSYFQNTLNLVPRVVSEPLFQSSSQKTTLAQLMELSNLIGQFLNNEKFHMPY